MLKKLIAGVFASALVITGCSGGEEPTDPSPNPEPVEVTAEMVVEEYLNRLLSVSELDPTDMALGLEATQRVQNLLAESPDASDDVIAETIYDVFYAQYSEFTDQYITGMDELGMPDRVKVVSFPLAIRYKTQLWLDLPQVVSSVASAPNSVGVRNVAVKAKVLVFTCDSVDISEMETQSYTFALQTQTAEDGTHRILASSLVTFLNERNEQVTREVAEATANCATSPQG